MADLLHDLTSGEDDFDVDLMAAGCRIRLVAEPEETLTAQQLITLYKFDSGELEALIAKLVEDGTLTIPELVQAAEELASGRIAR
jgi:hypothetical protein